MSDTVRDDADAADDAGSARHTAYQDDTQAVARVHHSASLDTGTGAPQRWFADGSVQQAVQPAALSSPDGSAVTAAQSPASAAGTVVPTTATPAMSALDTKTAATPTTNGLVVAPVVAETDVAATSTGTTATDTASTAIVAPVVAATTTSSATTDAAMAFFTAGDLVISVYGDGAGTGSYTDNQAAPIVLEELTTSGAYVTQITLPQTTTLVDGVTEYAVSGEYGSSSEGTLELSADGKSLVIAGYAVNAATYNTGGAAVYGNAALAQSTSIEGGQYTAVARAIADINADGVVDSSTALYGIDNTNNPRSVATVDGSSFYISGQGVKGDATQGVFVATDGASTAMAIDTSTDTRTVEIVDGTLYVSRDSKQNNASSIASYGGLPTGSTTATVLPGIAGTVTLTAAQENTINAAAVGTKVNLSPENYFFANSTTLYVADSGEPKTGSTLGDGGLQKWSLVNGTWSLDYTLSSGLNLVSNKATSGTTGLIGLTGEVVGNTVVLYATNATIGDLDQTYLFGITDTLSATTNPGESFTTLETAAADTNIRGVAFAPSDAPCYAAGTMILTDRGERAVEQLRAGDRALVPQPNGFRSARVEWVGERRVDIARHPDPDRVRPIRFAPGAIADGVPSRPLLLSPDHALFLDGVLVAARLLVNGVSVTVVDVPAVRYVHVELDRHDILLANNAPAESYLDTGNRHQFDAGGHALTLHPVFDRADHPSACARLATDAATVAPIHRRLAERAGVAAQDAAVTRDPNLLLVLPDGRSIAPMRIAADGRHSFSIDETGVATSILLRSRRQCPNGLRPWLDDRRRLGVGIGAVTVWSRDGGLEPIDLAPDRATPVSGWWPAGEGDPVRWTDGEAALVLPPGCLRLDVVVFATTEYVLAA